MLKGGREKGGSEKENGLIKLHTLSHRPLFQQGCFYRSSFPKVSSLGQSKREKERK